MKNENVSDGSIAKFSANLTLFFGLAILIANLYYEVIEKFSMKGLATSAIILCTTLSIFSFLKVVSKLSDYLDKK